MSRKLSGLILACFFGATMTGEAEETTAPEKSAATKAAPTKEAGKERGVPKSPGDSRARPSGKRLDQVQRASEALLETERQLRALEVTATERRRTARDRIAELDREKEVIERSTAVLTRHIALLEKDLQARKEKTAKDEAEAAKLTNQSGQILDSVKKYLARVEKHIDEGLPWQVEARKSAVDEARDAVAAPGISPREALAIAGRAHDGEEALGRLVEPGTVVLEVGGEKRAVPALRLGLLAMAYASEDGSLLGYAHSGQKIEAGRIETGAGEGSDKQEKAAARVASGYQTALAVLRRRLSPRLVDLYLPTLPASEDRR